MYDWPDVDNNVHLFRQFSLIMAYFQISKTRCIQTAEIHFFLLNIDPDLNGIIIESSIKT